MILKKHIFLVFILSAVIFSCSLGQSTQEQRIIDSLKLVLKTGKNDTNEIFVLHDLGRRIGRLQTAAAYQTAINYFLDEKRLAEGINFKKDQIVADRNIGDIYYDLGNYVEAERYALLALKISDEIKDPYGIASGHLSMGGIYQAQNKYPEALKNYAIALEEMKALGNMEGMGNAYSGMGEIYKDLHNYDLALKNSLAQVEVYKQLPWAKTDTNSYQKISNPWAYDNLGEIYQLKGNYAEALKYYVAAITTSDSGQKQERINSYLHIGKLYLILGNIAQSQQNLNNALLLAKQTGAKSYTGQAYAALASLYQRMGNYRRAFEYQQLYLYMKDSVESSETAEKIAKMQMQYEFDKNMTEEKLEQDKRRIAMAQTITRQRWLTISLVVGTVLLTLIALLWFNRFKLKKRIEQQAAIAAERKRISSEMHDDIGSGLSKISLLTEVLKRDYSEQNVSMQVEKISRSSKEMVEKMGELIWAVNARYDKAENLVAYIRKYAIEYFDATPIKCKVNLPENIIEIAMDGKMRRHVFLVVKEALHNVLKHSAATAVTINIGIVGNTFNIVIIDNGKGINFETVSRFSNGLVNMQKRMEDVSGSFSIKNHEGTTVELRLPIKV